ncbi:MAG: outer membrane protein assembly factor BamD [Alphaproteobacteria bacterium]|nr:outer membrane protein assembly factor BamD [Alphaproteobacteria bacterium]
MTPSMKPARRETRRWLFAAFGAICLLGACSSSDDDSGSFISDDALFIERPAGELYNHAMDLLIEGDLKAAITAFGDVERQHPYSVWATKAQLMAAYSHYLRNRYDEAIVALDRFIQVHPGNPDTPYAYYLKALCYYEQISDVNRDQKMTKAAGKALETLIRRFPDSKYARDARLKLEFTHNHLAGKEMEVGRYYMKHNNYLAAIKRFRTVVDKYQNTLQVAEALHRLTEAYIALGLIEEARKTAAVLGYNFPGSEWYQDSYDLLTKKELRPMVTSAPASGKPQL